MIVSHDLTIVSMIVNASIVVKFVMALLVFASMLSWTYIFMKLFGIRRARRDIDEGRDFWIDAGLGHDHAAEGMSYQDGRTILAVEHALGLRHRILQCRQRVLHGCHIQSRGLQTCYHLGPA